MIFKNKKGKNKDRGLRSAAAAEAPVVLELPDDDRTDGRVAETPLDPEYRYDELEKLNAISDYEICRTNF